MASLQVAGLASNFDWKSFVDSMMEIERKPIDRMTSEKTRNDQKSGLLSTLGTKLTNLQSAAKALKTEDLFGARSISSSTANSTWSLSAAAEAAVGTYKVAVTQLATKATIEGTQRIGAGLSTATTVSNLPTATPISLGTVTINGVAIEITEADRAGTFGDLLSKIQTEAGLDAATYNAGDDTVTFSKPAGQDLMLGAPSDESNLLQVLKLGNSGASTSTSSGPLGAAKLNAPLASANLRAPILADGSGNGAFKINGETITYNINTDTLSSVITKINDSAAGVTAKFDAVNDRLIVENDKTGDYGIAMSDTTGSFLSSMSLTIPSYIWRPGTDAKFTVNDGSTFTSKDNVLTDAEHGITGLSVTVDSETTQTLTVAADTAAMKSKIQAFVDAYNDVQLFLDDNTKTTKTSTGKVSVGLLTANREVQEWGKTLRSMTFQAIGGLSGTVSRLEHLGLDFDGFKGQLQIKDSARLTAALTDKSTDVAEFFQTSTTGFADKFDAYLKNVDKLNAEQQKQLTSANKSMDDQIATIERRLEQQRSILESAFIAMETAQSKITQQQSMLTRTFASNSS